MHEAPSLVAKISDGLVRYTVILFAFLLPFFILPVPWAAVSQSKALLAALCIVVALIAWLIESVASRRIVFSFDPILIAALLLPVAYAVSAYAVGGAFSSFVSGDAMTGSVASMLLLFGVALLAAIAVEERHIAPQLVLAMTISGGIVVLFQVARLFFPAQLDLFGALQGNTSSVVGSWHDLGIFVGFIFMISAGLLETSVSSKRSYAFLLQLLAALSLGLLLVINFSDLWYALAGAAFLFALARMLRAYRRQRNILGSIRNAIIWIVFAIVAGLAGFGASTIYSHLPAPLQISQTEVRPSWSGTFSTGQYLFHGGKAMVFGSGPNTFDRQWALFKPTEVNATNFWNTNFQNGYGVVPTAFVTVGIVGSLVWILLALALLWAGYRSIVDESEGRLRLILFVGCAFLLFFHIIYVPSLGISLLLFLSLGILAGLNTHSWCTGMLSLAPQSILAFVLLLVVSCSVIGGALVESRAVASHLYTMRASDVYQKTGSIPAAAALVAQAVRVDPRNDLAQRAAVQIGLLQLNALAQGNPADTATRDLLQKTLSDTISHGLAAVSIDDTSYQNWLALAGLYQSLAGIGVQGAYEQAQNAWLRAASTTPANPLPFVQLGQIAMAQSRNDEALAYFGKAIALKRDLALPYYFRAQIEAGAGNYQPAIQDAAAAAQLANQDPLGWYTLGVILYLAGDYTNAGVSLEKSIALQSNYSDAMFMLAVVYDKLGAHENALAVAQKVAELNPNAEMAQQAYRNLLANKPAFGDTQGTTTQSVSGGTKDKP